MVLIEQVFTGFLIAAAVVTVGFVIAYFKDQRYDLIDAVWGVLFIAIAWSMVALHAPKNPLAILMALLVTIWGVRLSRHIFLRWLRSPQEDKRYIELRRNWPTHARTLQVFVRIYLVQALLASVISLPVIAFIVARPVFDVFVVIGFVIWAVGIGIEATADRQLRAFISKPKNKGQLMTLGLWEYSRHPNYFGEMLLWWGVGIMGLGQVYGLWGLIGPLVISLLLRFVSGVPLAEKAMSNKPGWKEYKARTSVLFLWPSR